MEEKLKQIINHYGVVPQLKYLQSEVFELNEAIINYEFVKEDNKVTLELENIKKWDEDLFKKHIAEEIADVMVMLCQFKEHYYIDGKVIMNIMEQKIDRQLERIKGD